VGEHLLERAALVAGELAIGDPAGARGEERQALDQALDVRIVALEAGERIEVALALAEGLERLELALVVLEQGDVTGLVHGDVLRGLTRA
jgi:hypothetical protein